MSTYYRSEGDVRGTCGHKHETLVEAVKCTKQDQSSCRKAGGGAYSDRTEVKYVDGSEVCIPRSEYDAIFDEE